MKSLLKIISAVTFLLVMAGCNKDTTIKTYMDEGIITGFDEQECLCCGGLIINFHNDTAKYSEPYYRIDDDSTTMALLGISDSTKFPVRMKVNWVKDTTGCGTAGSYILITGFKKE